MHLSEYFFLVMATGAMAHPMKTTNETFDQIAGGGPPNGPPPATLAPATVGAFQLAGYNENLEAAFFEEGLNNITTNWIHVPHFPVSITEVIRKIAADEEVHVETAEGVVKHFNGTVVPRCKYKFPVSTVDEFLALGHSITSIGIGGAIALADAFARNEGAPVRNIAAILAVEARHDSFFRITHNNIPNVAAFDTPLTGKLVFNLFEPFVVPGSCKITPNIPIIPQMTVDGFSYGNFAPEKRPTKYTFSFDPAQIRGSTEVMYIGWLNQANKPAFVPFNSVSRGKGWAEVPPQLTATAFAILTNNTAATDVDALAAAALAIAPPLPIS
jgi:Ferritin-like domain